MFTVNLKIHILIRLIDFRLLRASDRGGLVNNLHIHDGVVIPRMV